MNFFPKQMMDGYKMKTNFTADATTMIYFSLGIAGVQMFQQAFVLGTMRTDAASGKAAGVTCLANALTWGFFVISDGIKLTPLGSIPKAFPRETVMGNCVFLAVIAGINLAGWMDAGKPLPVFTKGMIPTGVLSKQLIALALNLSFFAVGCSFFTGSMIEQFLPGVMKKFKPDAQHVIIILMGNAGKMMLFNILAMMMTVNAEPGNADTNYRILRCWVYGIIFYLGRFSGEGLLTHAKQWATPMRVPSFVSCFAVCFYAATSLGEHPITVSKTAVKAAKSKSK